MRKSSLLLLFLFIGIFAEAQTWPKIFGNNMVANVSCVIETYDKGYLILDNSQFYLWLIKTDINGNKLWEKHIGTGQNHILYESIDQTFDGGFILGGGFSKYDPNGDPCCIKLTACGELEWCTVIQPPARSDFARRARETPEGDYILLSMYSGDTIIQLYKLNHQGELLWKKQYQPDNILFDEEPIDVRVDPNGYLISGKCFYPNPGGVGGYERPLFIKTDTAGTISWYTVYGSGNGFHGFIGSTTIKSSSGNFYTTGRHSNYCDTPVLVKCMGNGQESYFQDFIPGSCPGGVPNAIFLNDTTLATVPGGVINGQSNLRWMKTDTFGVCQYYKDYSDSTWMNRTVFILKTFDNKIVGVSTYNDLWINFYKLNSNLDFDSTYTYSFVYDSLCPGGVVSDTINPDCGLIVGMEDLSDNSNQIRIFPNPAISKVTIELPQFLSMIEKQAGLTTNSTIYQWDYLSLEIYSIEGKIVETLKLQKNENPKQIDISRLNKGIYLFKISYKGKMVSGQKIVIQ